MPDYFYDMDLVVDPLNPSNVVAKGQVAIYDPADTAGTTLLALKDPSGLPLPNPLTSNANGFLPPRIAEVPQTLWKSGGFEGYFNSYKGLRDEAVSAVAAAQGSADAATTAVAQVVTTAAVDGAGALVLTKANGSTVNAGNVRGPQGIQGPQGLNGSNVLPTAEAIAQAVVTDGPAKSAIDATATATAKASTLRPAAAARTAKPLVVFTFDDNPRTDWTAIKPILDAKGIKATFCGVTSSINTGTFLTWAELRQLQSEGHEINNHSATHVGLTGASAALLKTEVADPYDAFVANGIRPTGYCYPGGGHDAALRAEVRKNHAYALTVGNAPNVQPLKSYALDRKSIDNVTTLATHQAEVDAAVAGNHVLVYLVHSGDLNAAALTKLGALIDYAKAKPVSIVTAAQAIATVGNLVDVGDYPAGKYAIVDGSGKLHTNDAAIQGFAGTGTYRLRRGTGTNNLEIASENTGALRFAFAEALLTGYASDGTSTRAVVDANDTPTQGRFRSLLFGSAKHVSLVNAGNEVFYINADGSVVSTATLRTMRVSTASRPAANTVGEGAQIYDTTIDRPIWSDGTVWRDAVGTAV